MQISIFGTGYVGLVSGACLAQVGNHVCYVDADAERIAQLQQGINPLYEPGLADILRHNTLNKRIVFSTNAQEAIQKSDVIFIAVGTPSQKEGLPDLQYVKQVAKVIGQSLNQYKIIVNKSTVPVGTAEQISEIIEKELEQRNVNILFDVVANPEFLREGSAIQDCMRPDRIILGTASEHVIKVMRDLYNPFNGSPDKIQVMKVRSVELTKYAANAMLATKISFINEMSRIAEIVGADIEEVRQGIGSDPRIGYSFLYPGCGYGGSCLPKDVLALTKITEEKGYEAHLLSAVNKVNEQQKHFLFEKIKSHFDGNLQGKLIALWGLSFKPNTDDTRQAPSLVLIDELLNAGALVCAYDPKGMEHVRRIYSACKAFTLAPSAMTALQGADALAIVTEWIEFKSPNFEEMNRILKNPIIFDGRNLYNPNQLKLLGFQYYSIGR